MTRLHVAAMVILAAAGPVRAAAVQDSLAQAADSALEARASALAAELRCPVCSGLSVQDSPSELAHDMKQIIREQLAAGKTEAEVRQFFIDRYGEWVLLEPEARGFNLVVWLGPVLVVALGLVVVVAGVRKWTRPAGKPEPERAAAPTPADGSVAPDTPEDEYLRRLREEVARGPNG